MMTLTDTIAAMREELARHETIQQLMVGKYEQTNKPEFKNVAAWHRDRAEQLRAKIRDYRRYANAKETYHG